MNFNNSVLTGGTYYTTENITVNNGALKALTGAASPSAFHNSGLRHDPPKCHENTRVAVLEKLKDWISGSDPDTRNKWIMWMYGGAGAGKSAIGQTFAEKCDDEGRLLASFFFGRSDATRSQAKFLVPTIACQVYKQIPSSRDKILCTIDNDPMIFSNTLLMQFQSLVIEPLMQLQDSVVTRNVIIIDGLDECLERASQTAVLRTLFDIVQRLSCRIHFLIASRPEHDIVTAFSLQADSIFARLVLDDQYKPDEDIRLFLNDKIRLIKETHPFRNLIPSEWPQDKHMEDIVQKSSGQFIYVSTAVTFIESIRHLPNQRMDIVRNLRPVQGAMPFAELDALYTHILTSAQDVPMIVELLSFVLHVGQLKVRRGTNVPRLEELHDLEPGILKLTLCDVRALVAINGKDEVKVLHASLLDFLIDPSRSKALPISGNALMAKHIATCFRYLSKNKISASTDHHIIMSTYTAVRFLDEYLSRIPVFTVDIAKALNGFSLFKLCQTDELPLSIKHNFLKRVNSVLLTFLRQPDQHQFLSRYLTMMDKSFLALMDKYHPNTLALQVSIIKHDDVFPRSSLDLGFQLPEFRKDDEKLGILCYNDNSEDLGPTKAQRSILCEFLLDPSRSRHHDFLRSGPKLYVMALLQCFDYLCTGVIWENFAIDETCLNKHATLVEVSNQMILENQGKNSHTENNCNKILPHSSEEYAIPDTENSIKAWQKGWQDHFLDAETVTAAALYDPVSLKLRSYYSDVIPKIMQGRYYLMLGYMIYFFPRAGFSQELIELCKTTVLPRHPKLFPEQTAAAQRAIGAYLERMANSTSVIDLVSRWWRSQKRTWKISEYI